MERQRSFSFKPIRLLVFSFTISSSVLFCILLSFRVINTIRSGSTEAHFQFNGGPETVKAEVLDASTSSLLDNGTKNPILGEDEIAELPAEASDSGEDGQDEILAGAQLKEPDDSSEEALDSVQSSKNAISSDTHFEVATNSSEEALVLVDEGYVTDLADTHQGKRTGFPGEGQISSIAKIEEKSTEPAALKAQNGNFEANALVRVGRSYNVSGQSEASSLEKTRSQGPSICDVSSGRWVFDESYPLYSSDSCPYIDEGFSCEANGRRDKSYMKWRWQPHECNIPRFNPVKMLELIRGKRLVFVGDSINRNQWESMLCLLRGAISDPSRVYEARGRRITKNRGAYNFKFPDYQCSVEFYASHYLVHESHARVGQRRVKTLRIDTMDRSSSRWKGADILVFNTAHWWSHHKTKAGVNYYQEGEQVHPRLDVSIAFRKALTTWASWIDRHTTLGKTEVFFRSSAPSHFSGGEWNTGGHCKESSHPLNDTSGRPVPRKNIILEQVIKEMRTPVTILNITHLSGLRIDGHPSLYGRAPGRGPPSGIQDCSHWCLPGVPDTWNELLYFYLLSRQKLVSAS